MKLLTVIVTYNGIEWIERCVLSLLNSNVATKIVVVDNGSADGTVELIEKNFDTVELVKPKTNLGFGQANNIGIKRALDENADYIFLLNQDAWVEEDTLGKLINVHQSNPSYGIISPMHLNGKGDRFDTGFARYVREPYSRTFCDDLFLKKEKTIYPTKFVNAAAWLVSAVCVKKIGGFDPLFFHYGEDLNYCHRAMFHGFQVGFCPLTRIYHDRDDRGGVMRQEFQTGEKERVRLLRLANINEDFNAYFRKTILSFIKTSVKYFLTFRFFRGAHLLSAAGRLARQRRGLLASRMRNVSGGYIHLPPGEV